MNIVNEGKGKGGNRSRRLSREDAERDAMWRTIVVLYVLCGKCEDIFFPGCCAKVSMTVGLR